MKAKILRRALNFWLPFLGSGISIKHISDDYQDIQVEMKLRWYNKTSLKTHFGGGMYAMVDPFYLVMLLNILGDQYVVWDKSAHIQFISPGLGTISARFQLSDEQIDEIRKVTDAGNTFLPVYDIDIVGEHGQRIASVKKQLYIRKKKD